MKSDLDIAREYPLHFLVWNNKYEELGTTFSQHQQQLEVLDPRGRSPLMLAVTLGSTECTRILVNHGANVNVENAEGWTVVQEAVASGDKELLQLVLEKRDSQRHTTRMLGVPAILQRLKEAPDFYMEMKWEFTSWVPLVSRLCPSDTYKVYKQGSNVRIDTTLLGFDQNSWQRGNKSYLFKGETMDKAVLMEMDHDAKDVYIEELKSVDDFSEISSSLMTPSEHAVSSRLTTPIVHTYVDTEKISFERNKCGLWGWRSDKSETINDRECKVFSATNVELVTKTRTEHLSCEDKNKARSQRFPLHSLLAMGQMEDTVSVPQEQQTTGGTSKAVTMHEYFDSSIDLSGRDIGRPKEMSTRIQKFKATLWLCENFPLSLSEQIMPIVDLMAISSSHFAKLKDFIQMQLPSGFPIKIEIPLFHVMNACVTFGNVFAVDESVVGVNCVQEDDRISCVIEDSCFHSPPDYAIYGMGVASVARRQFSLDEEDDLLQYAIQQSLVDSGSERDQVDIWEALKGQKPSRPNTPQLARATLRPTLPPRASSSLGFPMSSEEEQLQRAIAASLAMYGQSDCEVEQQLSAFSSTTTMAQSAISDEEVALAEALALSAQQMEQEQRRRMEDDELLERIIQLSLVEQ